MQGPRKNTHRDRACASGQSLVEFVLTLFAFFTIMFMYVQVALSFAVANYIQYATFMAARAYLSGAGDPTAQTKAATAVLNQMLSRGGGGNGTRFDGIIQATGEGDPAGSFIGAGQGVVFKNTNSRNTAWEQGVTYQYNVKLYMLPFVKSSSGQPNSVTLESQSWLGREPSSQECMQYMSIDGPANKNYKGQFQIDNGC